MLLRRQPRLQTRPRIPLHPCLGTWAWEVLLLEQPHLLRRLPPAQHPPCLTRPPSQTHGHPQAALGHQQQVHFPGFDSARLADCAV